MATRDGANTGKGKRRQTFQRAASFQVRPPDRYSPCGPGQMRRDVIPRSASEGRLQEPAFLNAKAQASTAALSNDGNDGNDGVTSGMTFGDSGCDDCNFTICPRPCLSGGENGGKGRAFCISDTAASVVVGHVTYVFDIKVGTKTVDPLNGAVVHTLAGRCVLSISGPRRRSENNAKTETEKTGRGVRMYVVVPPPGTQTGVAVPFLELPSENQVLSDEAAAAETAARLASETIAVARLDDVSGFVLDYSASGLAPPRQNNTNVTVVSVSGGVTRSDAGGYHNKAVVQASGPLPEDPFELSGTFTCLIRSQSQSHSQSPSRSQSGLEDEQTTA